MIVGFFILFIFLLHTLDSMGCCKKLISHALDEMKFLSDVDQLSITFECSNLQSLAVSWSLSVWECGPTNINIWSGTANVLFFEKINKDVYIYIFNRSLPNLDYKTYCYCPTTEDVLNTIFLQPLSLLRYRASNVTRPHTKNIAQSPSKETQGVTWVWTWNDVKPPSFSTVKLKKKYKTHQQKYQCTY